MNVCSNITDNVTELLVHIVEFTERRNKLLMNNVLEYNRPGFTPMDLDVTGFADLMTDAVSEHVQNERLLLRDTETIRFGCEGVFESSPVADESAKKLIKNDTPFFLQNLAEPLFHLGLGGREKCPGRVGNQIEFKTRALLSVAHVIELF